MTGRLFACLLALAVVVPAAAQERIKVDAQTPAGKIMMMDPSRVDASALPLTSAESLHATGTYRNVDLATWRLTISGKGTGSGEVRGAMVFNRKDYGMDKGIPFIKIADHVDVSFHLKWKHVGGPPAA